MYNKRPIIILGFQRGGTTVLLNWLRTHPDVCSPWGETHQVFMGIGGGAMPRALRLLKLVQYLPIILVQRELPFYHHNWQKRKPMARWLQTYVDWLVYRDKFRARGESQNRYKAEGVRYTRHEIAQSRTLLKSLNGDIFTVDLFQAMYPDATFLALVRNGYAVIEGHLRRGAKLEEIASNYERAIQQIIRYNELMPNLHIVKFEDILSHPLEQFDHIYELCGLDKAAVSKVRLETKPFITRSGEHKNTYGTSKKVMKWIKPEDLHKFLDPSVNENQIKRLSAGQKARIMELAGSSLKALGYVTEGDG